jgi:hypothetical protein
MRMNMLFVLNPRLPNKKAYGIHAAKMCEAFIEAGADMTPVVPRGHRFSGEHYWELGKRGYPLSRVRTALERHGVLLRGYVPFEHQHRHFFVIGKHSV